MEVEDMIRSLEQEISNVLKAKRKPSCVIDKLSHEI
jgi:hypothetical protein